MISQNLIGGYMYLRSLIGPAELLYMLCETPGLVHDCMKTWFELADAVTARHQEYVTFDEVYVAEDICYNHGALISPGMMREFLLPYYEQLLTNIKQRQRDKNRPFYLHIDTDGFADPVIPIYREIGMNVMSPFEVASGCDVVRVGREYPDLAVFGGIDKRILAATRQDIDWHLERILPAMRARGGYIPTCDHGVPEEVSLDNYLHYRKRCLELGD
jgi:uroporphyrinogen decarboxylase